jgi:Xaa-Pro aminopeptidase
MTLTSVPPGEFERRIADIREPIAAEEADALCLFSGANLEWLSGFTTSRRSVPSVSP